ncbi:MAG: trehalose-phosphatase [Bdellovibrionales bacterium]
MAPSTLATYLEKLIGSRADIALLSDFDGTLVDLVPDPEAVDVPAALAAALGRLAHMDDFPFAIVTGRALGSLDRFLGNQMPAIGNHGAEIRLTRGGSVKMLASPMPQELRDALRRIGEANDCIIEDKLYSVSLHVRVEDAAKDLSGEIARAITRLREPACFMRQLGRTYEILQEGITKGSGITVLMNHPGFKGKKPVYVGDDVETDESLSVVRDLGGVLIPAGEFYVDKTKDLALSVAEVRQLIGAFADT